MPKPSGKEILAKYLPEDSVDIMDQWIRKYNFHLRITRKRATKLGDYRSPTKTKGHRISVNGDLNKYAFLITLVHEIAHLTTWEKHKHKVKPHGAEWKQDYSGFLKYFMDRGTFPKDINKALDKSLHNPTASSCTDLELYRALKKYDPQNGLEVLENLSENVIFKLNNGRLFKKGRKLRKRYKCLDLQNQRYYMVNPLVEVMIVRD